MKNKVLFLLVGLVLLGASCRKSNFIGEDLIPDSDHLQSEHTDTFSVITYTDLDDSVVTSQNVYYAFGSLQSDQFGKSAASIYAQLRLPTNNIFFGNGSAVDSVVITLDYAGYYGDTTQYHKVNVYRLVQPLQSGRLYYSDTKLNVINYPLGSKYFKANERDSVTLADGSEYAAHLRINLNNIFGDELIHQDSAVLENDSSFLNYLRGIYIAPDTSAGYSNGIMYFDLASALSGVRVYYHNDEADSLSVLFPFTGVNVNRFTHNYSEVDDLSTLLSTPDTLQGDAYTYVQGFGGLRTIVKFPTLENLKDVSINKAELILTSTEREGRQFPPPPKIQLIQIDTNGHNYYYAAFYSLEVYSSIVDDDFGFTDIGGVVTKDINDAGRTVYRYTYRFTEHVQEILNGDIDNNGFALICQPGNRIPNAVILGGSGTARSSFKPVLSITYTTVNK